MKKIMRKIIILLFCILTCIGTSGKKKVKSPNLWPGGTVISEWFNDTAKIEVGKLGKKFVITEYGVKNDSMLLQTSAIQAVIDRCAKEGGGVVVVPSGTFLTGALFFKKGVHLHLEKGGTIKGIDDIRHYPLISMHMEGKMINYFAALITAEHCDGFTITGKGRINGNGQRFWDEFWIRRKQNPRCTNLEALRPQLLYISHSNDVTIQNVSLVNSPFWTSHLYKSNRIKFLDCFIKSPAEGTTHAPSSDAIDLDICDNVLVKGCYINVCDDGVCLKGGKGTFVDQDSTAGSVNHVLVENCTFGNRTNAGITFGSEAWDCHNVIMRNCHFDDADHMLLFKMRADTPQCYGDVLVENLTGTTKYAAFEVSTWTQFHQLEQRTDMPISNIYNVTIRNSTINASSFFRIKKGHPFMLSNFYFENIKAEDRSNTFDTHEIENVKITNVILNGVGR